MGKNIINNNFNIISDNINGPRNIIEKIINLIVTRYKNTNILFIIIEKLIGKQKKKDWE